MVFNRAIGYRLKPVAPWCTREMINIAHGSPHKPLVQTIRKLAKVYGSILPAVVGQNVHLTSHPICGHDDDSDKLKRKIK